MTDDNVLQPAPASRSGTLRLRLAVAFISVALVAVALLAGLTAAFAAADVSALAVRQRAELMLAIAGAAGQRHDIRLVGLDQLYAD